MGTSLPQFQGFISRFLTPQSTGTAGVADTASAKSNQGVQKGSLGTTQPVDFFSQSSGVDADFTAAVYTAKVQQAAMMFQMQKSAASSQADGADGSVDTTQSAGSQMTFQFFGEVRSEELAVFQQRTGNVADGLEGSRKETYMEISRKVAARFEFSFSVSGEALGQFANTSEGIQDGSSDDFDKFLALMNDALKGQGDVVDVVTEILNGFFGKGDVSGLSFDELMNKIYSSGLLGDGSGTSSVSDGQSSGSKSFSFQIQMEFSFEFSGKISVQQGEVQESDPLAFDLDGDGLELTSYKNGARFDLKGDGQAVTTGFVTGGDAFLAIDRNGNGIVDNGKELFGEQNGAANGYAELAKLDSNNDGVISALDKDFSKLLLFKDNGDGKTDAGELISLAQAGISEIRLRYGDVNEKAAGGNRIAQVASYKRTDGSVGRTADAILRYTV